MALSLWRPYFLFPVFILFFQEPCTCLYFGDSLLSVKNSGFSSVQIWFMSLIMTDLTALILELSLPVQHLVYFKTLWDIKIFRQCVLKYNNVASLCGTRSHVDLNHRVSTHFHPLILKPMFCFGFKADLFWKEEEDSCLELGVFIHLHALILKSVSFKTFTLSMSIHFLSAGSPFLFVNASGRYGGQRGQLLLPPLKENDTHCVSLMFYRRGATPTSLNIYVRGSVILV